MTDKQFAADLNDLLGWLSKTLPIGYTIEITATGGVNGSGEVSLSLFDDECDPCDVCFDDLNMLQAIVECVNQSRANQDEAAGLEQRQPVEWHPGKF
ncbi:MAG: hypothetical protein KDB14_05105 [Planctomycetales bacterium]|nr:hypothetical protein [Planctomycetales bacterium]